MLAVSIIGINIIFYLIVVPLVKQIGFYRKGIEEITSSQYLVVCLFLDMVILPILVGINLTEFGLPSAFNGKHTDFGASWYPTVGRQIAMFMLLFCLQPIIDLLVSFSNLHAKRWYKRTFVYRDENEMKRDTLTYIDMHAGPEYPFYYQTSKTVTVMLICLIFGGSMPILYLVGIIALII